MEKDTEKQNELPYGADIKMMNDIIDIIGRSGTIETGKLYQLIPSNHKPIKSYSKKMAEFFGLISSEGLTLRLTKNGSLYRASKNEDERKAFLAQHLPEKYVTIISWLNGSKEGTMTPSELSKMIISTWGDRPNKNYFSWVCNNFALFCSWIGVISYSRGQNARYTITEVGKAALEVVPARKAIDDLSSATRNITEKVAQKVDQLSLEGSFPIKIISRGTNPLELDIHYEEDWEVVESYIKLLKNRWSHSQSGLKAETSNTKHVSSKV